MLDIEREISTYGYIDRNRADNKTDADEKAIQLYNAAIDDIKTGNSDIAYIKLKKATSLKHDFYDARLLIGLYFVKTGSISRATTIFENVLKDDKEYGTTALKYLRAINADRNKKDYDASADPIKIREKKSNLPGGKFVYFILGILIGALFSLPAILSDKKDTIENETTISETSKSIQVTTSDGKVKELEKEVNRLLEVISGLEDTIKQLNITKEFSDEEKIQLREKALGEAKEQFEKYLGIIDKYNDNEIIEAADEIISFVESNTMFTDELEVSLLALYSKIMDKAARYCEDRGVALYESGKYEESLDILEKASFYRPNYQRMYRVIYYIGKNLLVQKKYDEAKEKFLEVTKIAPNSDWIYYANLRLAEINDLLNTEE